MNKRTILESGILLSLAFIASLLYSYFTNQGFFEKENASRATEKLQIISLESAKNAFFSGGTIFIDARHEFEYTAGHIRGAWNIPLYNFDNYQTSLLDISKSSLIVVYCDGAQCNSSIELATRLVEKGFTNVKVFFGGWQEWTAAGLPTEP